MNKKRVFNYGLLTLLVILGIYFVIASGNIYPGQLDTLVVPSDSNTNISGTTNLTFKFTSIPTPTLDTNNTNVTTNVSFFYSTDNTTWTRIGTMNNGSDSTQIYNFSWNTASTFSTDQNNVSIMAVVTNQTSGIITSKTTYTTTQLNLDAANNVSFNLTYKITIDNLNPTVNASTDIATLNVSMVGNAAAPIANASLNGNSYLRNGTDILVRLYVNEANLPGGVTSSGVWLYYNTTGGTVKSIDPTGGSDNATRINMVNLTASTQGAQSIGYSVVNSPSVWEANISAGNFTATSGINLSFAIVINDTVNHFTVLDRGGNSYKVAFGGTSPSATITADDTSIGVQGAVKVTCSIEAGGVGENTSATYIYWQKPSQVPTDQSSSHQTGEKTFQNEETGEAGTYYAWCSGQDNNGRTASSDKISIEALYTTAGEAAAGGGGGGGSGEISTIEKEEVLDISAKSGEATGPAGGFVRFTIDGTTKHKLTFDEVTATSASITIESDPIKLTLNLAETKEIDLDSDGKNDMSATLSRIVDNQAVIKIEKLAVQTPSEVTPAEEEQPAAEAPKRSLLWLWILIAIIVIAAVVYFIKRKK
ncbi:MAG: hypothetical protein AB1571_03540 [Nanoarchaeota archaeon]